MVAILLPFGVGPSDIQSLRVQDGGRELETKIKSPRPFYDISKMHKSGSNVPLNLSL